MDISGVLIHARPEHVSELQGRLALMDGVEIHAAGADGRLVITLENELEAGTSEAFEQISRLPGVLSATMIYHHFEPDFSDSAEET